MALSAKTTHKKLLNHLNGKQYKKLVEHVSNDHYNDTETRFGVELMSQGNDGVTMNIFRHNFPNKEYNFQHTAPSSNLKIEIDDKQIKSLKLSTSEYHNVEKKFNELGYKFKQTMNHNYNQQGISEIEIENPTNREVNGFLYDAFENSEMGIIGALKTGDNVHDKEDVIYTVKNGLDALNVKEQDCLTVGYMKGCYNDPNRIYANETNNLISQYTGTLFNPKFTEPYIQQKTENNLNDNDMENTTCSFSLPKCMNGMM